VARRGSPESSVAPGLGHSPRLKDWGDRGVPAPTSPRPPGTPNYCNIYCSQQMPGDDPTLRSPRPSPPVSLNGTQFLSYGYDDASRLTGITQGTSVFGFGYDNANRRTSLTYPNSISTAYTYDTLSRLTNLSATLNSTVITQRGSGER